MPLSNGKARIFVVDDEHIIASTLTLILRQQGFDATSFFDPVEVLKAADVVAPDLLISDVVMPRFSGIELAIKLRTLCPKCKILLFSGQAATKDLLDDARAKGNDFEVMTKPIHPTDLLKRVGTELGSL